eukprot:gnl/TRDRNA2_/TRDRNA2_177751_c1_seq4.p1 gnl/TRDRNA2_/TRDRNA2_177751_c1~~gnl/TRDRNA2_/TRDRNA2_177751_c1_seq4.p1  ORF type:complete len:339 (-),score=-24.21 gnl/TRDRNA2_/TRDRNA2_177751_c1_seq4:445-1392(-)
MSPDMPGLMERQPTINIGLIGHVAHGKSTIVRALSGIQTVRFKDELKRNITMKLGYANTKIYRCSKCPAPQCYQACGSKSIEKICPNCDSPLSLIRHISLVDCPGHDEYMETMLNGTTVMDGALLIISANEKCPQPQTSEHLAALDIMKLEKIIVIQNKIDLVPEAKAKQQYEEIRAFLKDTIAEGSYVIPISAQHKYNIEVIYERLVNTIPIPRRDFKSPVQSMVIRSFDANRPGTSVNAINGGIAGGSITQGILRVGTELEIRPGRVGKNLNRRTYFTMFTQIVSLKVDENYISSAVPGGLIGIGTLLDPFFN